MNDPPVQPLLPRMGLACFIMAICTLLWMQLSVFNFGYPTSAYGFPLVFKRVYHPTIIQFFTNAFLFDLMVEAIITLSTGFTFWRWSAYWKKGVPEIVSLALLFLVGLYMFCCIHPVFLIVRLSLLFLLLLVPIIWLISVIHALWCAGNYLLGESLGYLFFLFLAIFLPVMGSWCGPHDIFCATGGRSDIPALTEQLTHQNPHVRALALSALDDLGPFNEQTSMAILHAMADPEPEVRSKAFVLAPQLGPYSIKVVPLLREQFLINGGCIYELMKLGPAAKDVVPTLKHKLSDAQDYDKLSIAQALWKIEGDPKIVVPALIELLKDDFGPIRRDAVEALGEIGPEAKVAVPLLREMVAYQPKPDPPQTVTTSGALPSLRAMSDAEFYPQIREAAERALQRIERPD